MQDRPLVKPCWQDVRSSFVARLVSYNISDELFHDLTHDRGQADQLIVSWYLVASLLVDGDTLPSFHSDGRMPVSIDSLNRFASGSANVAIRRYCIYIFGY